MKNLLFLFFLLFSISLTAQENKYQEAAEKARIKTNNQFAEQFEEADKAFWMDFKNKAGLASAEAAKETNEELKIVSSIAAEIANTKSRIVNLQTSGTDVITNEKQLPEFLTDFTNGAKYYKAHYTPTLDELSKVVLIRAELNFLGGIVEIDGKKEIWLNATLLQYPYLYKMVFYRQMGKLYCLKEQKGGSMVNVMTDRWEINPEFENYAYKLSQNHTWKKRFFTELAEKHPLDKKI